MIDYWDGADLVMEVVSPDDPERDNVLKREDYARAGIPEYWIVDPAQRAVTVLVRQAGGTYHEQSRCAPGAVQSTLLAGFQIDAGALWTL
jgi:Uma2 family endonuclease